MSRAAVFPLLLALALFLGPVVFADEEAAEFFTSRGRKALEEKNLSEAERQFGKALGQWKDYAPAVLGLAEIAIAREDTKEAIGYLATCLAMREAVAGSEEGRAAIVRAGELMKKLERPRYEYWLLVDEYVTGLMKLANGSIEKNKDLARRCAERVLLVRPDHAGATAMLEKVGPAKKVDAKAKKLFNGKDLTTFVGVDTQWKVKDGTIEMKAGGSAFQIRTREAAKGDFTLRMEMRVVEDTGGRSMVGLSFAFRGLYERHSLNVFPELFAYRAYRGTSDKIDLFARKMFYEVEQEFDRRKWSTYEIRIRGSKVTLSVNGEVVFTRTAEEDYDGPIALTVQDCTAEIRKLTLSD
jgi:tetratricopeptide (TPR) repeat protein